MTDATQPGDDHGPDHAHGDVNDPGDVGAPVVYDDDEVWKKWHRRGFGSVKAWHERGMISIDVGETEGTRLVRATKCFVNPIALVAWLRNPAAAPDATFVHYGGGHSPANGDISRVLKFEPIGGGGYWIKTGHFPARRSPQGGYIPDMKAPLSVNSIKVTAGDLAELQLRLELLLIGWAASSSTWITETKKRD